MVSTESEPTYRKPRVGEEVLIYVLPWFRPPDLPRLVRGRVQILSPRAILVDGYWIPRNCSIPFDKDNNRLDYGALK